MAAKLQGRAYLSSFADAVLNKLSSLDVNSTPDARKLADQKLLQKLRKSLRATRPVLDDAEQKQIRDQEVKKWLVDLQDALYLADDLLDELSTKAATATPTQRDPGNFSSQCHSAVNSMVEYSDDDEMEVVDNMQDIVDKLESIVEEKDVLGLKQEIAEDLEDISWRIQSSLVESSDIYGRDSDKEAIVEWLLDNTCNDKLSVISIEGIGGIGKTTLAQWVYNDARMKEKFAIKAWVCVATKFDPVNVTKAIIEDITSSPCNKVNLNSLQTELKEKLTDKTFLIVLDDVWDNQQNLWDNFLKSFLCGNKGSKILLTSRNKNVDSVVSTTNRHYSLHTLSPNDCWSMFLKHSSLSTNSTQYTTLEQIGRKIVKKCKGLPLAVKTLGGLLRNKYNEGDWENILDSEIWELSEDDSKIVPALRVSYHYLPSHLKRCFVYCSLYPEDHQFGKDELMLLWMAEDLLQPMGNNTLENIGCAYFDELVARSFFQPSSTDINLFVMHDLMHDLATSFAGKFHFKVKEIGNPQKIFSITRHLSYTENLGDLVSRIIGEAYNGAMHMRTFLQCHLHSICGESDLLLLLQLRCLRVLSFKGFNILSLPDSIGELIHLRYLDLTFTPVVRLPESLCKLYNLQTLKLRRCYKLEKLPSNMQDLVNLRHLDIEGASCLKEMPKRMSKLKHLNLLGDYIVGKHEENGIKELGTLDNLHGSFCISNLENVNNSGEASEAKMGNKKHINILKLKWLPHGDGDNVDVESERDILDKLQPHRNLKELLIDGYRGEIFPDWLGLGLSCCSNITKLIVVRCKNCCELPSLGQLPSLQELYICELDGLERIGCEFYKNDKSIQQETPFKALRRLVLGEMHRWREWHVPDEFDCFPKLERLLIVDCPVLTGDLPAHLPALEELVIGGCEELACSLPRAPKLCQLLVTGTATSMEKAEPHKVVILETQLAKSVLECLPHIQSPYLQTLRIVNCWSAIPISGDYLHDSLQYLQIAMCPKLTFSEQLQHKSLMEILVYKCDSLTSFALGALPSLRVLQISECPGLVSMPALRLAAPHLEELCVEKCQEMEPFGEDCLPSSLTTLRIYDCKKLERWITSNGLQTEGLIHLFLIEWNEVKSFPREGCLPASLQSLQLYDFANLETLDCKGLQHLTSLQTLAIEDCPKLENITQENLPASILKLRFEGECPLRRKLEEMNDPRIQFET
ncbi:putative disease resistance RPP13-like protein 1 [Arachis hypogaea]|uniref:putative disease resistance RPP13-like protein 1 n=1 Tax=Arachis hypogaea TaxID=3818 RepID=UPI000DEC105E|nr:putative disease resistance RPP13-like protein 1 [Arachis hypogaea]XP_025634707.1 putative disease resistance RPP13-like protein 1 [Arachis hypogaea]XP_025634708.1 putative disease resistance RPP13-like protein 1 [Arachis hypogaea]XP_025634709.1 putative disease resistance RPP13-like protein 1 [Arachis hypogaea]XP_025634710.1 putative disease resistance RPP13-like protein 1 [Arachis hypogaea]